MLEVQFMVRLYAFLYAQTTAKKKYPPNKLNFKRAIDSLNKWERKDTRKLILNRLLSISVISI